VYPLAADPGLSVQGTSPRTPDAMPLPFHGVGGCHADLGGTGWVGAGGRGGGGWDVSVQRSRRRQNLLRKSTVTAVGSAGGRLERLQIPCLSLCARVARGDDAARAHDAEQDSNV